MSLRRSTLFWGFRKVTRSVQKCSRILFEVPQQNKFEAKKANWRFTLNNSMAVSSLEPVDSVCTLMRSPHTSHIASEQERTTLIIAVGLYSNNEIYTCITAYYYNYLQFLAFSCPLHQTGLARWTLRTPAPFLHQGSTAQGTRQGAPHQNE